MTTRGSTAKLGMTQRAILLWLGKLNGLEADVRAESSTQRLLTIRSGGLHGAISSQNATKHTLRHLEQLQVTARRQRSRNADKEDVDAAFNGRIDVRWTAEAFLGHPPTRSESATLSEALTKLQRRGFLRIRDGTRGEGAKRRARFVRLTPTGVAVCKNFFAETVQAEDDAFLEAESARDALIKKAIW